MFLLNHLVFSFLSSLFMVTTHIQPENSVRIYIKPEASASHKIQTDFLSFEISPTEQVMTREFLGTLNRENAIKMPTNLLSNLSETAKKRKIKVAFIDSSADDYFLDSKNIKTLNLNSKILSIRELFLQSLDIKSISKSSTHGIEVFHTFKKVIEDHNLADNFEYYYCGINDIHEEIYQYKLKACLNWLKEEQVDALNISSHPMVMAESSLNILKELAHSQKVAISLAAGNDNAPTEKSSLLCQMLENVFCVGSISDENPFKKNAYSNYGYFVNAWENGHFLKDYPEMMIEGTSFASPRFLAKFMVSQINKDLKIKHRMIILE